MLAAAGPVVDEASLPSSPGMKSAEKLQLPTCSRPLLSPTLKVQLARVKQFAARQKTGPGRSLMQDDLFAARVARAEVDILALEFTENRIKSELGAGKTPGALSSMTKILGTEMQQRVTELAVDALGPQALIWQPKAIEPGSTVPAVGPEYAMTAMARYLNTRATSIYGGSNEVQRGIIAKMVLGL